MRARIILVSVFVFIVCIAMNCQAESDSELKSKTENPVENPSFEESKGPRPVGWRRQRWGGRAKFEHADIGKTGDKSAMISSEEGADASWSARVTVRPYSRYKLTGWIKTENLKATTGRGAQFSIQGTDYRSDAITGDNDWTEINLEFESDSMDVVQVDCLYGGWGFATGKAWFDDISLTLLSKTALKPEAIIDASKKGKPISEYIYGQFIEHLGRCIYGGIWAEMLEDRKFWYPVDEQFDPEAEAGNPYRVIRNSPWKIIGPEGCVEMVRVNSYVGEHTPQITVEQGKAAGIVQSELALIKGRKYVGRVVLAGDKSAAPVKVSLVWGKMAHERDSITINDLSDEYKKFGFEFIAKATTDNGRLEIVGSGKGTFRVGTASIMPADNIKGMRADTLKLLKELNSPVYRWPGGNFVSGYNWRDGINPDRDKRPPRKNPAWTGVEHNDFGMHEYIEFCRILGTEPMISVNTGLGSVEQTAEEVEYANGSTDTELGKLRAKNGAAEPFGVKFWCVGNEMYGNWQLGNMPLEEYVLKHNECADAMKKADPTIELVAVGSVGSWDEMMMDKCAEHMDLISEHFYCQERQGLMGHISWAAENIKRISDAHRRYREVIESLKGKDIRIAMDEWNYWYGPHVFGELGTRYFLKDGLGIAKGLHEYYRNSDIIYMANYAQTVNVIGCIKTSKTAAEFETTGLVLKLYRKEYGSIPVEVSGSTLPLDVAAALSADGKKLTISIVNPIMQEVKMPLEVKNVELTGKGKMWVMTGDDPQAYNEPGKPRKVNFVEKPVSEIADKLMVPALSASLYSLEVK
jgi:alpha-N-arabinofuranosidase